MIYIYNVEHDNNLIILHFLNTDFNNNNQMTGFRITVSELNENNVVNYINNINIGGINIDYSIIITNNNRYKLLVQENEVININNIIHNYPNFNTLNNFVWYNYIIIDNQSWLNIVGRVNHILINNVP